MAEATLTAQSAGRANLATGAFTGDASTTDVTVGFTPRYVKLVNLTSGTVVEKIAGMTDAQALQTATGDAGNTITTTSQIVITEDGFTVLAATAANEASIVWMAAD